MKQQEFSGHGKFTYNKFRFLIIGKGAILYLMHERG